MYTLNCKGKLLTITDPVVMGIINITPDSFYAGSRMPNTEEALQQAAQMVEAGATFIDIGGQSSRPGSDLLSPEDELSRIAEPIKAIKTQFPNVIISVDTFYSDVARAAINMGAAIINDISGGLMDNQMLPTAAALQVPYICMHMQGTPQNMQLNPVYKDIALEVLDYFIERIDTCRRAGIHDVIIDPGFGFGKTIEHNYELLQKLSILQITGKPILAGMSRKSMIYKPLGETAATALNGTTAANMIALMNGASILRVHDVKEAVETIKIWKACQQK